MAVFSARTPVPGLSPDEIERMRAEHRLYLETEYHQGHRALGRSDRSMAPVLGVIFCEEGGRQQAISAAEHVISVVGSCRKADYRRNDTGYPGNLG